MLICTILCFVLVLSKTKTKLFLILQWYFDLSKQKVLLLLKPKQSRAGQRLCIIVCLRYTGRVRGLRVGAAFAGHTNYDLDDDRRAHRLYWGAQTRTSWFPVVNTFFSHRLSQ